MLTEVKDLTTQRTKYTDREPLREILFLLFYVIKYSPFGLKYNPCQWLPLQKTVWRSRSLLAWTIEAENLRYVRPPVVEMRIAQLLAAGRVVARFNRRMEFGPRALGNRSILYYYCDGTARPQVVRRETNASFHRVLEDRRLTGIGTVVNTSFNMHEESIVCTPEDALRSFLRGHLDYLAIGPYVIENPNLGPSWGRRRGA